MITQDIVAPLRKKGLSEKSRISLTRWIILAIGLYVLYWGLFYEGEDDIWDYMAVSGAIYFNGAIAVLVGGIYWKKASSTGAFVALLAGFTAIFGLGPVQQLIGLQTRNAGRILGIETHRATGRAHFRVARLRGHGRVFPAVSGSQERNRKGENRMNWVLIWKIVFLFVLSAFAVMAVLTTFLGAKDIRSLFRDLNKQNDSRGDDDEEEKSE